MFEACQIIFSSCRCAWCHWLAPWIPSNAPVDNHHCGVGDLMTWNILAMTPLLYNDLPTPYLPKLPEVNLLDA